MNPYGFLKKRKQLLTKILTNRKNRTGKSNVRTINIGNLDKPKAKIMVCTPCHSEVSMHYTQAVLKFQLECMKQGILVSFSLLKIIISYTR